jgi:hypothetical protein
VARRLTGSDLEISNLLYDLLVEAATTSRLAALLCDSYVATANVVTDQATFLDGEDDGTISYLTPKRITAAYAAMHNLWTSTLRQRAAPGRVLRKIITPEAFTDGPMVPRYEREGDPIRLAPITDAEVEHLTIIIQARYKPRAFFIVTGEAIRWWYWEQNYTRTNASSLHQSCMRYASNWNDVRFYAQNPLVCGLLCVLASDGKLAARALLWNGPDGIFMDRVYGSGQDAQAFRSFADKRGWRYRRSDLTDATAPNRGGSFALPLQQCNESQKPAYLDSFSLGLYHATGDLAVRKEKSGRVIQRGDIEDEYTANRTRNPVDYAAITLNPVTKPGDHPLAKTDHYGRDRVEVRDRRVAWLSDFSAIPPWPTDLVRHDPTWSLGPAGSEPEDDEANRRVIPPRRTTALVVDKPKPVAVSWSGTLVDGIGQDAFRANIAALEAAFNRQRNAIVEAQHEAALAMERAMVNRRPPPPDNVLVNNVVIGRAENMIPDFPVAPMRAAPVFHIDEQFVHWPNVGEEPGADDGDDVDIDDDQ